MEVIEDPAVVAAAIGAANASLNVLTAVLVLIIRREQKNGHRD